MKTIILILLTTLMCMFALTQRNQTEALRQTIEAVNQQEQRLDDVGIDIYNLNLAVETLKVKKGKAKITIPKDPNPVVVDEIPLVQ